MPYKTLLPFEFGIIIYVKLQIIISCISYVKLIDDRILEIYIFIVLIGVHFRHIPGKVELIFSVDLVKQFHRSPMVADLNCHMTEPERLRSLEVTRQLNALVPSFDNSGQRPLGIYEIILRGPR